MKSTEIFLQEKDSVYSQYKKSVNMTYSELLEWSKTPCSKKASLSRSPIKRNLILLKKPKYKWNKTDIKNAKRTINYLSRSSGIPKGKVIKECGLTRNQIARKNWGRKD